jgi:hypothetical protein
MKSLRVLFGAATLLTFFLPFNSTAQILGVKRYTNDTRIDVGVSMGFPTIYAFKSVVGADVRLQKDFSPSIAGLANVGFSYFLQSDAPILSQYTGNSLFLPIRTGAKVFLTEKLYVTGGIGTAFRTRPQISTSFLHSEGVGFEFSRGIDVGLGYESFTQFDVAKVALKVAYAFHLKKRTKYMSWYK